MVSPVNLEYYLRPSPGRADYWRKMAAPRFRVAVLMDLLRKDPPARLVDLGCGNGELLWEFKAVFPSTKLCGIDLSSAQIEANRTKEPVIDWRVIDLEQDGAIPAELKNKFGAAVASEIIEHIEDPERFLRNARELALPSTGTLLLSTQSGKIWETEKRVGHIRHFSRQGMVELFLKTGWKPVAIWNAGFPFHDWSRYLANLKPERTMERFSGEEYGPFQNAVCRLLRLAFKLNSNKRGSQLFAVAKKANS